jgi:hypothetical protein
VNAMSVSLCVDRDDALEGCRRFLRDLVHTPELPIGTSGVQNFGQVSRNSYDSIQVCRGANRHFLDLYLFQSVYFVYFDITLNLTPNAMRCAPTAFI